MSKIRASGQHQSGEHAGRPPVIKHDGRLLPGLGGAAAGDAVVRAVVEHLHRKYDAGLLPRGAARPPPRQVRRVAALHLRAKIGNVAVGRAPSWCGTHDAQLTQAQQGQRDDAQLLDTSCRRSPGLLLGARGAFASGMLGSVHSKQMGEKNPKETLQKP